MTTKINADELPPLALCVACNGVAKVHSDKGINYGKIHRARWYRGYAQCTQCGLRTDYHKNPLAVRKAWNYRATSAPALAAEAVRLEKENTGLKNDIDFMREMACKAATLNDADNVEGNTMKAHKIMLALGGLIKGYDLKLDKVFSSYYEATHLNVENKRLQKRVEELKGALQQTLEILNGIPSDMIYLDATSLHTYMDFLDKAALIAKQEGV